MDISKRCVSTLFQLSGACALIPVYAITTFMNALFPMVHIRNTYPDVYTFLMKTSTLNVIPYLLLSENCSFCFSSKGKGKSPPYITPLPITFTGVVICGLFNVMKMKCVVKNRKDGIPHMTLYMNDMKFPHSYSLDIQTNGNNINIYTLNGNKKSIFGTFLCRSLPKKAKHNPPSRSETIFDSETSSVCSVDVYELKK